MTYRYLATGSDHKQLLDFIFDQTDLQVFESYSSVDVPVCQYRTPAEILGNYNPLKGLSRPVLRCWSPSMRGKVEFQKILLDKKRVKSGTFRYETIGWGLIQLALEGFESESLSYSTISHQNHKTALQWENTGSGTSVVNDWDWKVVEGIGRKLKNHIHRKLSVSHVGAMGVLSRAEALLEAGIPIIHP